jgi:5-carboxymethyl-2-hydroxymuconate isomerase
MPQVSIEYSANLAAAFDPRAFAMRVHEHLVATVDTDLESCKTRLIQQDAIIGDGSPSNAMVHVDLRILSGRTPEQKTQLGKTVFASLQNAVKKPDGADLQLTVEVRELDRGNYHKVRLTA